jgi:BolA protein
MMNSAERITCIHDRLEAEFSPGLLQVIDESDQHIGHAGAESGMGHFRVIIQAEGLSQQSSITAHRAIYSALADLMKTDIHALAIEIK